MFFRNPHSREIVETSPTESRKCRSAAFGAGKTPNENEEVSLLDLAIILAEHKHVIFWITLAFAIAAALISPLLPKSYTAHVALLPPQESPSDSIVASQLEKLDSVAPLVSTPNWKTPNDPYVGMLKSRTVEDALIQRFELMQKYHKRYLSETRRAFEQRVDIDGDSKGGMIHISVEDSDPRLAAEIANGYVEQFRSLYARLVMTEAWRRRLFYEGQLEQARNNLANAEAALKTTEQKTGVIQLNSQVRSLIELATSLRAQATAKEVQVRGMQTYATGENAQLIQAQEELAFLRSQLAKLSSTEDNSDEIIISKDQTPEAAAEYVRKVRDVKYYETIFNILTRQFELAKLDEARQGPIIPVVDPAIPPDKYSFPNRGAIVIGAIISGLLTGIYAAFALAGLKYLKSKSETNRKLVNLKQVSFGRPHTAP